jgi:Thiopurine S-methyltransferase (TPMT)
MNKNDENTERWQKRWHLIVEQGQQFWKADEAELIKVANYCIESPIVALASRRRRLLIPFSGDCLFAVHAYNAMASSARVDCVEIAPLAIQSLKEKFADKNLTETPIAGDAWTLSDDGKVHRSACGRVCIFEHSVLDDEWPGFDEPYDMVYDKDAFGAVAPEHRQRYIDAVLSRTSDDAVLLFEVKEKAADRDSGPPFHIDEATLSSAFGKRFDKWTHLDPLYTLSRDDWVQHFYIFSK